MTKHSPVESRVYNPVSNNPSLSKLLKSIMPKSCRSSYNLAFKLKVVAEVEAVENNSKITRDYGSLLLKRSNEGAVTLERKSCGHDIQIV